MEHLIMSILSGIGLAILMVEMRHKYPVRSINVNLRYIFHVIGATKFKNVFKCSTCLTFWTTILCDIFLCYYDGHTAFAPFSSFISCGVMWLMYEVMKIYEAPKVIYNKNLE